MISPLIPFHFDKQCRQNGSINPPDIPVFIAFISRCPKVSFLGTIIQNFILGKENIHNQGILLGISLISIPRLPDDCPWRILQKVIPIKLFLFIWFLVAFKATGQVPIGLMVVSFIFWVIVILKYFRFVGLSSFMSGCYVEVW